MDENSEKYVKYINTLTQIGVALSAEKDHSRLLKMILAKSMDLCNADGGTLYLVYKKDRLSFSIIANKTLNIPPTPSIEVDFPLTAIPLYIDHQPNLKNVVCYCYHQNQTINITDIEKTKDFDFSGTHKIDEKLGYHSVSFLTIPLRDDKNNIIGILQLINAMDETTGKVIPFSEEKIHLAESLASQAAIILIKHELMQAQKVLFESLIQLIARAIDEKCSYTSKHCSRVPLLTMMIANAVNNASSGPLKDFHLTKDQFDELTIAAWLHDCGKISIPEYVINKAKKLETIIDRMELVDLRIEIIKRDLKIALLEKLLNSHSVSMHPIEEAWQQSISELRQAQVFLKKVNIGGEFLTVDDKEKIKTLAKQYTYVSNDSSQLPLLTEEDVSNLSIERGTLNEKERKIIQNHVSVTQKMLSSLPYPDYLKKVPEIAGNHHESLNGKGYPHGVSGNQLSMQARIVTIADVFEALTAADRPYKTAKTLKESLSIMQEMKNKGQIDPDLFDLFVQKKIYLDYAKQYLNTEQIDIDTETTTK